LDEEECLDRTYYKSRWAKEKVDVTIDGQTQKVELEQQLIVTYSIKYRNYLRFIRDRQVERAKKMLEAGTHHGPFHHMFHLAHHLQVIFFYRQVTSASPLAGNPKPGIAGSWLSSRQE